MALPLRTWLWLLLLFNAVASAAYASATPTNNTKNAVEVITLCYHDVRDDVDLDLDHDSAAVHSKNLAEQFEWLRQNGYQPVSVEQIKQARDNYIPLPPKPVLLTFDDGYESFYTRIYPLLKLYHYPAVMALVGSWLQTPANSPVQYGNEKVSRQKFLTAAQIREMQASGLIEFASHSYNLHKGILGNPQGNMQPAMVTRLYNPKTQQYESLTAYKKRILDDLRKNHRYLQSITGVAPRIMVWPYGEWNHVAETLARQLGYTWFFELGDTVSHRIDKDGRVFRHMLVSNPTLADFASTVRPFKPAKEIMRAAHVDLDYVYDANPKQQAANLDKLLERINRLHISTVFLQAFADPDGDGNANAVYFPNKVLPMRADLFNRVAWQLKTRARVKVYAWMPVLAFDFGQSFYLEHGVQQWNANGKPTPSNNTYRRLSLFDPTAQSRIRTLYHDLAVNADFEGLLFHDDALLDWDEDFHPAAQQWMAQHGLSLVDYAQWQDNENTREKFTALKVEALNTFIQSLANEVRIYRPEIKTARNIYASAALDPNSPHWLAQNFKNAFMQYDYVALMAMPWMEKAQDPTAWTSHLIKTLSTLSPAERNKFVVELQTRDWRTEKPISNKDFREQVMLWKRAGYQNFAWYPDDFIANVPDFTELFSLLSLEDYPYERR